MGFSDRLSMRAQRNTNTPLHVFMRNISLSSFVCLGKGHIDHIMGCYGQQILQFVVVILEGGHAVPIKEQALCLVANIADGNDARNYIMNNEDVLRKIMNYMLDTRTKLQVRLGTKL